jgi:hypothetical protein
VSILGLPSFFRPGGPDGRQRVGYEFGYTCKGVSQSDIEKGGSCTPWVALLIAGGQSEAAVASRQRLSSRSRCPISHRTRRREPLRSCREAVLTGGLRYIVPCNTWCTISFRPRYGYA